MFESKNLPTDEELSNFMNSIQPYAGNRYKVKNYYDPKYDCRSEFTIIQSGPDGGVLNFTTYGLDQNNVARQLLDLLGYTWITKKEE